MKTKIAAVGADIAAAPDRAAGLKAIADGAVSADAAVGWAGGFSVPAISGWS